MSMRAMLRKIKQTNEKRELLVSNGIDASIENGRLLACKDDINWVDVHDWTISRLANWIKQD